MLPYLQLGPLLLQLPGLALLAGVWFLISLAERDAKKLKLSADAVTNVVFVALIGGIIGARLAYALRYFSAYLDKPLSLFSLNPQTLAAPEGAVIGLLAAVVFAQRKNLTLRSTLDALTRGLAAFMIAVGVAHILSGDAFGAPTTLPWAIDLWGAARHPTQIYETILAIGVLGALWRKIPSGDGTLFLQLVAFSAGARLFLETFRGDSAIWWGGVRAAQGISLLVLLLALYGLQQWKNSATG